MGYFTVKVLYNWLGENKPYGGAKVCLRFEGLLSGGFTEDRYTDGSGEASFDVGDRWEGTTVYVDGSEYGTFPCQGGSVARIIRR